MDYVTIYDSSMRLTAVLDNADAVGYKLVHNDLWTGSFSLPNDDPKNVYCQPGALVMIPDGERMTGLYRIIGIPDADLTGTGALTTYDVEHVLATLLDDVIFGEMEIAQQTPADAITALLALQTVQRWVLGVCEYADPITLTPANETLLSALQKISGQLPDDYTWTFDTTALPWVLNITHADTDDGCGIHYARNLVEIKKSMDASQIVTRLYLVGGADQKGDQVKVGKINDGLDYIEADTLPTWGVRCAIYGNSEIDNAEELLARGRKVLETYKAPYYTYQATALDLHRVTGQSWDDFLPGKLVRVMDDEHGVRFSARIVSIEKRDVFGDPGGITVTIANQPRDQLNNVAAMADKLGSLDSMSGNLAGGLIKTDATASANKEAVGKFEQSLSLKASQKEVDTLTGRMTTAESALEITPQGISLMAQKFNDLYTDYAQILVSGGSIGLLASQLTNVEGWINGSEASLELYGDRIESRVSTFEGRVSKAESAVEQYSNEIKLYVKQGDLNSSIVLSGDGVDIRGGKITLTGIVTATQLQAELAAFNDLKAGRFGSTTISAGAISGTYVTASGGIQSDGAVVGASINASGGAVTCGSLVMGGNTNGVHTLSIGGKSCSFVAPADATFDLSDMPGYDAALRAARSEGAADVRIMASDITSEGGEAWYSSSKEIYVNVRAEATNGEYNTNRVAVDASAAYNAGVASVDTKKYYDNGYNAGYTDGWMSVDADEYYEDGYDAGYSHGMSVGRELGYDSGYEDGEDEVTVNYVDFAWEAGGDLHVYVSLSNGKYIERSVRGW